MDVPLVASDLEGTLSGGQAWRGMRGYLKENGRSADFGRFLRRRLHRVLLFRLGLLPDRRFKEQWILDLLQLFAGMTADELAELGTWVVEQELWPRRRRAIIGELLQHRDAGRDVLIVSGMIQPILDQFSARLGIRGRGTPVQMENGRFSGHIHGQLNTGDQKVRVLQQVLGTRPLLAAYGDTVADIPMLALSQHAVAVYPDKRLRRVAAARGWRTLG